jgi:predicted nucleotidyltransferase
VFQQLLESLARGLESRHIRYMVVGGQAVLLYGEPRLTRDIDVTVDAGPERLADIQDLAASQGWQSLVDSPAEFVQKTLVLPVLEPASGIRIDFIFSFSPYEQQAMDRVRRVRTGQIEVCYASVEDLIISKTIAGRPRDLEDLRSILLKNPTFDLEYIRKWLREFDRSLAEAFLERFERLRKSVGPD